LTNWELVFPRRLGSVLANFPVKDLGASIRLTSDTRSGASRRSLFGEAEAPTELTTDMITASTTANRTIQRLMTSSLPLTDGEILPVDR
jgi:hypothetical protein